MVLTLLIPARSLYQLHDIITWNHIDVMCKIILLTGSMVGYSYLMEFFVAYYGTNPYERFIFLNRYFGPYWWCGFGMFTCNVLMPQLFWVRAFRRNIITVYFVAVHPGFPDDRDVGGQERPSGSRPSLPARSG
jgi:molybdopterin-containing oxidoreductase family membrane subunit